MTTTLRTLLSELDRPDLPDAAKQVVQLEIEKLLGRNAREILEILEKHEPETKAAGLPYVCVLYPKLTPHRPSTPHAHQGAPGAGDDCAADEVWAGEC